jgi:hypothetical protein
MDFACDRAGAGRCATPGLALGLALAAVLGAGLGRAGTVALPSGQQVAPLDRSVETQDDGERWLILRYLAPRIAREGGDLDYPAVVEDLDLLCETDGLAAARDEGQIAQVVIVLMDRPVTRGTPDPDATQFIGAYVPADGGCLWQ